MEEPLLPAIELFNDREFFRCHEVLEEVWKAEHGPRRRFLQALIHIAVGLYHAERGNARGAAGQLKKGIQKLSAYLPSCEGLDTALLHRDALAASEAVEAGIRLSIYPRIHFS